MTVGFHVDDIEMQRTPVSLRKSTATAVSPREQAEKAEASPSHHGLFLGSIFRGWQYVGCFVNTLCRRAHVTVEGASRQFRFSLISPNSPSGSATRTVANRYIIYKYA